LSASGKRRVYRQNEFHYPPRRVIQSGCRLTTEGSGFFVRSGHHGLGLPLGLFNPSLIESFSLYPPLMIGPSDSMLSLLAGSLYLRFNLPTRFLSPASQLQFFLVDGLQGGDRIYHCRLRQPFTTSANPGYSSQP
jgi:hypothetical protein